MEILMVLRRKADELLRKSSSNSIEFRKFQIINDILKYDDCFLAIDIEHAYAILRDLGIDEEQIDSYYDALIAR